MPGGLMSLVSEGQSNILLNGNPSKSFFKSSYLKYTNFGLQKFRVDFEGSKSLQLTEDSFFTFKIPRYADLLMDCYLSIDIPNIWSPIIPPTTNPNDLYNNNGSWVPYEFRWIEYLGSQMCRKIEITCGNQTLQEFSGAYLTAMVQRDFSTDKKGLFEKMIGQEPELNNPGNSGSRVNSYPNAYYTSNPTGSEPSIRGRTLYIPLNCWFNMKSQMAFPLVALQYNELHINITMRPIQELFQIRDVFDTLNNFPLIAPNFNTYYMQFYRFLQTPPDIELGIASYVDTRTLWNSDINLNCTYCFLSNEESRVFALNEQKYLFKQVRENTFYNVTGTQKIDLNSLGMTSNYTFFFQRSDANLRNEWTNYSNWPYNYLPNDLIPTLTDGSYNVIMDDGSIGYIGPGQNLDGYLTGYMYTGLYNIENVKGILLSVGLLCDGIYRENIQPVGVFNYIEKYLRTSGNGPDGLYVYNFGVDPYNILQPSGAFNTSRFNNIQFETQTIIPPLNPLAQNLVICDPITGNVIGTNKSSWNIYDYNYNCIVFEERYNMCTFVAGNAALSYAT